MKHFMIKFILALSLGLGLTFVLLGAMSIFEIRLPMARAAEHTVCSEVLPTCTFTNVQAAVDAAGEGDVIKVASGTYTGVNNYDGLTQVVYISKSVTIRGGYTTAFTEPPNPEANPTTLDAQGQGRVLYITGDISPTIEGLRITGGNAFNGGGVYVISATVNLINNWVFGNTATDDGGGLYLAPNAILTGNKVTTNTAGYIGGGLFLVGDAIVEANIIVGNTAFGGGGVLLAGGSGILQEFGAAKFSWNTISSNSAWYGGGLDLVFSTAVLSSNLVSNNTARLCGGCSDGEGFGGGLLVDQESDVTLINNVIVDNQADVSGSGLYVSGSSPRLLHNTIARNSGGDGSGIHVIDRFGVFSTVSLTNTILVSHSVGITVTANNTATLESTLWGSGAWANGVNTSGAGTINATNNYVGAPAFVDPNSGNYHIGPTSTAIDKGINAGVTSDIDGEIRPQGSAPDLGADETAGSGSSEQPLFLPIILKE
jgi:fibronectin-binding autotransporter adhesin